MHVDKMGTGLIGSLGGMLQRSVNTERSDNKEIAKVEDGVIVNNGFVSLLERAGSMGDYNAERVLSAKKMIANKSLITPENIGDAAENLLKCGI